MHSLLVLIAAIAERLLRFALCKSSWASCGLDVKQSSVISVCLQEDHFEQLLDTTSESVNILFCSAGWPAVAAALCVCNTLSSCCSFCDRLQRQLCEAAALPPLVLSLHCNLDYIHCLLPWLHAPMCYMSCVMQEHRCFVQCSVSWVQTLRIVSGSLQTAFACNLRALSPLLALFVSCDC